MIARLALFSLCVTAHLDVRQLSQGEMQVLRTFRRTGCWRYSPWSLLDRFCRQLARGGCMVAVMAAARPSGSWPMLAGLGATCYNICSCWGSRCRLIVALDCHVPPDTVVQAKCITICSTRPYVCGTVFICMQQPEGGLQLQQVHGTTSDAAWQMGVSGTLQGSVESICMLSNAGLNLRPGCEYLFMSINITTLQHSLGLSCSAVRMHTASAPWAIGCCRTAIRNTHTKSHPPDRITKVWLGASVSTCGAALRRRYVLSTMQTTGSCGWASIFFQCEGGSAVRVD